MADYNYNAYERETVITLNDAENFARIETYQRYWMNRILKAKEKADKNNELSKEQGIEITENDIITIVKQTDDMLEAVVPRKFIKISPPRFMSAERRAEMSERAKTMLAGRGQTDEDEDDFAEDEE